MRIALTFCLLLVGCYDTHTSPHPYTDASVDAPELACDRVPAEECFWYELDVDRNPEWHWPYGTCDNPHRPEYPQGLVSSLPGVRCLGGGTCDIRGFCGTYQEALVPPEGYYRDGCWVRRIENPAIAYLVVDCWVLDGGIQAQLAAQDGGAP